VVRGRHVDPRGSLCKRRREKGGAEEPEDHALGRSRGGWGTKIHLVTDGQGLPLAAVVTPGQAHESKSFEDSLNAVRIPHRGSGRPRRRPTALAADKGYSYRRIRHWLHRHKIQPVIPQRSNQVGRVGGHRGFDKGKYRRRNVVERCVSWLKECRRVATRFEKLAVNDLGMIDLAIIQRLLRVAVS
jgi:transposase